MVQVLRRTHVRFLRALKSHRSIPESLHASAGLYIHIARLLEPALTEPGLLEVGLLEPRVAGLATHSRSIPESPHVSLGLLGPGLPAPSREARLLEGRREGTSRRASPPGVQRSSITI